MRKSILIIGRNSFIATSMYKNLKTKYFINKISFERFKTIDLKKLIKFDYIINCSLNKNYISKKYSIKNDIDTFIVNKICRISVIYIFLSTRKVYFPKPNIRERDKINPISNYGKNKSITESKITKLLKKKLLILRVSNIIGEKPKRNLRKIHKTFIDIFFENISKGYIFKNNDIYKDFLTAEQLSKIIHKLIKNNANGIYNVSLGKKVLLSNIVNWLLKYNKDKLKYIKFKFRERNKLENKSFYLNNDKLRRKINIIFNLEELKKYCFKLSKKFFYEKK